MKREGPSKILPRREMNRATSMPAKRKGPPRRTNAVRDGEWLDRVRDIPSCVRCGKFGVEAAHRDYGKGASLKTDDAACAALCKACHTELGEGKGPTRDARRAEMDRCIVDTVIALRRLGGIGANRKMENES